MKNILKPLFLALIGILLFQACEDSGVSENTGIFDPEDNLPLIGLELTSPGGASGSYFMDLGSGSDYKINEAMEVPEKIDFAMLWGSSTGLNIVSISDVQRLSSWGAGTTVNEGFYVKNSTEFVKRDASEETDRLFDGIETQQQVRDLYVQTRANLVANLENDPRYNGPAESLRGLEPGDLILVKSAKGVYGAMKVESIEDGFSGGAVLTIKLDIRDEKQIPPIEPSQVLDVFNVEVTEPGAVSGKRFLNVAEALIYSNDPDADFADQAFFNQESIDLVFLNGPVGDDLNLIAPSDSERLEHWPTGSEINVDWSVQNDLEIFKLDASALADSLYRNTYSKNSLADAHELALGRVGQQAGYDQSIHGPGKYVSQLKEGELLFVNSVSKNIRAMIFVEADTQGDAGMLDLALKVDNSERVAVPPPPIRMITLRGVGASTSDYIDFVSGSVYKKEEAGLQPENIDLAHLRGSSSKHNLISITNGAGFGAFTSGLRAEIEAWPVRNRAQMINLGSVQEYVDLYDGLDEDDAQAMSDAYDLAAGLYAPSERLTLLATGDIIMVKSEDRGLVVAIKVLEADDSGGITLRYKLSQQ